MLPCFGFNEVRAKSDLIVLCEKRTARERQLRLDQALGEIQLSG